jgi:glycosyltransferase involved in cell wall biosynthesis/peptidoglycan/xylan/chitin deacetylase (PgdA/CDA1 family)
MSPGPVTALVDLARHYGGAETRVVQLLATVPDTTAVCLADGALHRRCRALGLPVRAVRGGRGNPALIAAIARELRRARADVVDAHGVAAQLWGLAAARLAGARRRVATVHSEYRAEQAAGSVRGTGYEAVLRATRLLATDWVAVSGTVRDELRRLGLPADRITVVRSGVGVPADLPPAERAERRGALGLADDDLVVAVVGRLHPGKGHRVLLDAVAEVRDRVPGLRLLLVGDGPERPALEVRAAALGVADRVTFTGFRDDVPDLLRLADASCLPTDRSEGLPYAALEAAAAGLPIVATRLGAVPDVFTDGRTALLVPPADRDALVSTLAMLTDAGLRAALGDAAAMLARDELSTAAMRDATMAVYGGDRGRVTVPRPPLAKRARRAARTSVATLSSSAPAGAAIDLMDRVARRSADALPVLMYHRVAPRDADHGFDPVLLSATPDVFAAQVERLSRTSRLLSLDDVIAIRRGQRRLPERAVLLTFDDAYAGFLQWAWPVLRAHDVPCVVFVPTAYPGHPERQFWWEDLYRALQASPKAELATPLGTLDLTSAAARTAACRRLSDWVKATDHEVAMRHLDDWLDDLGRATPVRTTMDWDQLRDLAAAGVAVAPHSRSHAMLDRLPPAALADEIDGSIAEIRANLGDCPPAFCFPAGQRSPAVRAELERAGVEVAFSTVHGVNRRGTLDWLDLQRIDVSAAMPASLVQLSLQPWAEPLAARLA